MSDAFNRGLSQGIEQGLQKGIEEILILSSKANTLGDIHKNLKTKLKNKKEISFLYCIFHCLLNYPTKDTLKQRYKER